MDKVLGEPQNKIDPFTQEEVQLLEDKLVLSNGNVTVAVSGENFLAYIKSEIGKGKSLKDIVLNFENASTLEFSSLNLDSVDLSSQVWIACHILDDNYASEFMGIIYIQQAMVASYERRLATLDVELLILLKEELASIKLINFQGLCEQCMQLGQMEEQR